MAKGIGQYMHNIRAIPFEFEWNLIAQTLIILSIIPIWYWCINY